MIIFLLLLLLLLLSQMLQLLQDENVDRQQQHSYMQQTY